MMANNLKDRYDPDRYKPVHERITDDPTMQNITATALKAEEVRKKNYNMSRRRQNGEPFLDISHFVMLDPLEPLEGQTTKSSNRIIFTMVSIGTVWFVFGLIFFRKIQQLLKLSFVLTVLVYLAVGLLIMFLVVTRVALKVDESRRDRAMRGSTKSMNMGQVWGINPAGIKEDIYKGSKQSKIFYSGNETIVIKILKTSVLVTNSDADWGHYDALRRLEDLLIKNRFKVTKYNTTYNTNNDPIWNQLSQNLDMSSQVYGKEYTDMMNQLIHYQHKYTEDLSNVGVTYMFLQPEINTPSQAIPHLFPQIEAILSESRAVLGGVSNNEFIQLLKSYYGVYYLDIDSISDFISTTDINVDIKLISFLNGKGELVEVSDLFQHEINTNANQKANVKGIKDLQIIKEEEPEKNNSIYGDKFINLNVDQRGRERVNNE